MEGVQYSALLMSLGSGRRHTCATWHRRGLGDLPVGRNLRDHLFVHLQWARENAGPFQRQMRIDRRQSTRRVLGLFGTGPNRAAIPSHGIFKTRGMEADIEFIRASPVIAPPSFPAGNLPTAMSTASAQHFCIHAAGDVTPARRSWRLLRIRPNSSPNRKTSKRCARPSATAATCNQKPLIHFATEVSPAACQHGRGYRCLDPKYRHDCQSFAGTCAMEAVLLPWWIRNLRSTVLRASGWCLGSPDMPSAHINATVIALAERASDLIRAVLPWHQLTPDRRTPIP